MPLTAISCAKYVKGRCKNYDDGLVKFYRIGSTLIINVVSEGRIVEISTFPEKWVLDRYVRKIQEIFNGQPWDFCEYYRAYNTDPVDVAKIYIGDDIIRIGKGSMCIKVNMIRSCIGDCGFEEVGKPEKEALSPVNWLESIGYLAHKQ